MGRNEWDGDSEGTERARECYKCEKVSYEVILRTESTVGHLRLVTLLVKSSKAALEIKTGLYSDHLSGCGKENDKMPMTVPKKKRRATTSIRWDWQGAAGRAGLAPVTSAR